MAAQGYIGRGPGEGSVVISRQSYAVGGITTNFTFTAGYTVGYVDAYINGVRLIEGQDYTAQDGTVVGLTTHAQSGDALELVAYKAFNVGDRKIGIQSSGTVIGSVDAINFTGVGNTFSLNGTTMDVTISAGAGGTWATYTAGIATVKAVGVNTTTMDDADLVGSGTSMQGLYISNGMMVTDNALNGNHYIGTNFNGLMAGPVTINGTLTVDGNYVVV
tara:strand:+ start:1082 stop:1735 length:654 start_codon:yes stop_codon:yes gene_type:complete